MAGHPADEASVYHYLWVEARPREVSLQHAASPGGLIAPVIWQTLDVDDDRDLSPAEQRQAAEQLLESLQLSVDGKPVKWRLEQFLFPGYEELFAGGLAAIRLKVTAPLPKTGKRSLSLVVRDFTYPQFVAVYPEPVIKTRGFRIRRREVLEDGRKLRAELVPAAGAFDESPRDASPETPATRAEPRESAGLRDREIFPDRSRVLWSRGAGDRQGDVLRGYLRGRQTPGTVLLALAAAVLAGIAHALTPGHGKSVVAGYLVGARATRRDAVLLGLTLTLTHTGSVLLLGVLSLWLSERISTQTVSDWLTRGSGALVLVLGALLLHTSLREFARGGGPPDADPSGERDTAESPGVRAGHRTSVLGLGVAGGLVPCLEALAILVAAIHLGSLPLGLLLIAGFGAGVALVLVAVGLLCVGAAQAGRRLSSDAPWVRALPVLSGAMVCLLGLWLTLSPLLGPGGAR